MNGFLVLLVKLVLSAVFAVAGATKLADRRSAQQSFEGFGLPSQVIPILAWLLPVTEILIAVALWPTTSAAHGAIAALLLLLLFTGAIAWNLFKGRKPDCRCFGQLSATPIGKSTLIRNVVLAGLAAFLVFAAQPTPSVAEAFSNVSFLQTAVTALALLTVAGFAIGGWLILNILQQQGRLMLRIEAFEKGLGAPGLANREALAMAPTSESGLFVGTPAPAFKLPNVVDDTLVELTHLLARNKPVVLLFSDPGCGPCNQLMPQVATWQKDLTEHFTLAIISRGDKSANQDKASKDGLRDVLLQKDYEIADSFKLYGTPGAVLIGADGKIMAPAVSGADAIERLVRQASGQEALMPLPTPIPLALDSSGIPAVRIGDQAPEFNLQNLTGQMVKFGSQAKKKTVLLFWNPGCGFCSQMLDRLKQWEKNRSGDAPELIVISSGAVQTNRAMGLASEVVLDQSFNAGALYGASGTPSAVLVDEQGRIASEVTVGANAVMELAGEQRQFAAA